MTEFQAKVYSYIITHVSGYLTIDTWSICAGAFPDQWKVPAKRGMMVTHIDRAATKLGFTRIPPKDRFAAAEFGIPSTWKEHNGQR